MRPREVVDLFDYHERFQPARVMWLSSDGRFASSDLERHLSRQEAASQQLRESLDTQHVRDADLRRIEQAGRQFREWLESQQS